MISEQELKRKILFMLLNEPGFLTCCIMGEFIGATTGEVSFACFTLETRGILERGTADGNKLAFKMAAL